MLAKSLVCGLLVAVLYVYCLFVLVYNNCSCVVDVVVVVVVVVVTGDNKTQKFITSASLKSIGGLIHHQEDTRVMIKEFKAKYIKLKCTITLYYHKSNYECLFSASLTPTSVVRPAAWFCIGMSFELTYMHVSELIIWRMD